MVTVSHVVQKLIDEKVFVREGLAQGIISYTSLAEKIKPEVEEELGKKVKLSAIVMALRRYEEKLKKSFRESSFNYFLETILKTDICYIVVNESVTLSPKLLTLYHIIDFKKGGILNIVQGNYEVVVITNQRYKKKVIDLLKTEKILTVVDNLVSISLTYSKDFLFTPGVMYNILRFVAGENINIIDIILTPTELSLIIEKKDAMKCYKVLEKLTKKSEENQ